MPTFSQDQQRKTTRFREQRWRLDAIIKTVGVEWDQNRLHYLSGPLSPDYKGPVLGLEKTVKRWDDIAPEFTAVARRFEIQALAAAKAGHPTTARDGFFAASVMYGGAQWPILANTELNHALEDKKNTCFARYIAGADHRIEAIEIPYRGKSTGTDSDEDFAKVTSRIDVSRLSAELHMPYFVLAGEDETLSDFGHTIKHMNAVPGPKMLVAYAGEEHGIFGARSSQLGPPFSL